MWYNRTTNKFEGRENGEFVNLTDKFTVTGTPTANQIVGRNADNDAIIWVDKPIGLPTIGTENNGKFLKINNDTDTAEWTESITTAGASALIKTSGASASIYTEGANAFIQTNGASAPIRAVHSEVYSINNDVLAGYSAVTDTSHASYNRDVIPILSAKKFIQTGKLTTTERDEATRGTTEDGRLWYNRTTNKFEGRENGAFVNLGLPAIGTDNNGKFLKINNDTDTAEWADAPSGLPAITATTDRGKILQINDSDEAAWADNHDARGTGFRYRHIDTAVTTTTTGKFRILSLTTTHISVIIHNTDADGQMIQDLVDDFPNGFMYIFDKVQNRYYACSIITNGQRTASSDFIIAGKLITAPTGLPASTSDCYIGFTGPSLPNIGEDINRGKFLRINTSNDTIEWISLGNLTTTIGTSGLIVARGANADIYTTEADILAGYIYDSDATMTRQIIDY